jgi:hypothetical protein
VFSKADDATCQKTSADLLSHPGGTGRTIRPGVRITAGPDGVAARLLDLARRAGVQRFVVNGSFVTDQLEPNDVDCVLLVGPGFPRDAAAEPELLAGLPFVNMELAEQDIFQQFTEDIFANDRRLVPKGMIEVIR